MNAKHQDPKALGHCLFCALPVTDTDGLKIDGERCIHLRCSQQMDNQTFSIIDFLMIVTEVETAIESHPLLYGHYWDHIGDGRLIPRDYLALIRQLTDLARSYGTDSVLERLESQIPQLLKLTTSAN